MRPLRLLFITPYVPSLLRVRSYNIIKHLAERGHEVVLCAVRTSAREGEDACGLAAHCRRIETARVPRLQSYWNCARGLHSDVPLQAWYCYSPALQRRVDALLRDGAGVPAGPPFDVVHIEHLRGVLFGLRLVTIPRVFDAVDCISELFARAWSESRALGGRVKAWVDLARTRRFEAAAVRRFEQTLATSEADRRALLDLCRVVAPPRTAPGGGEREGGGPEPRITVLPNGVDLDYFRPGDEAREAATLVYVGRMSYHANITAVLHLAREVMPLVWRQRPDVRLRIVGERPGREIRKLPRRFGEGIMVTGSVPDVRAHLARAAVAVSPMVYAVGIQNKVIEAMAMGTPVVSSPAGCAALSARDGAHLLVARDPGEFAGAVLRLLADPALRLRIGAGGRRYVEANHDWDATVERLEGVYREVIARFEPHD